MVGDLSFALSFFWAALSFTLLPTREGTSGVVRGDFCPAYIRGFFRPKKNATEKTSGARVRAPPVEVQIPGTFRPLDQFSVRFFQASTVDTTVGLFASYRSVTRTRAGLPGKHTPAYTIFQASTGLSGRVSPLPVSFPPLKCLPIC